MTNDPEPDRPELDGDDSPTDGVVAAALGGQVVEMPPGSLFQPRTTRTHSGRTVAAYEVHPLMAASFREGGAIFVSGLHPRGIVGDRVAAVDLATMLDVDSSGSRWSVRNADGEHVGRLTARDVKTMGQVDSDSKRFALLVTSVETGPDGVGHDLGGFLGCPDALEVLWAWLPGDNPRQEILRDHSHPVGTEMPASGLAPTAADLLGSHVLVEIVVEDPDGSNSVHTHHHGIVTRCDATAIEITGKDGNAPLRLPALRDAFEPAQPGKYVLDPSGEVVTDVDFLGIFLANRHAHHGKLSDPVWVEVDANGDRLPG